MNALVAVALALVVVATPLAGEAQPARVPVVGVLFGNSAPEAQSMREALIQGFRNHGYVEGRNVRLEYRYADSRADAYPTLADELIRLGPDVLVGQSNPAVAALMRGTKSIPVVMAFVADPIGSGFIASLARLGGNVTGLSTQNEDVSGKWVELLMEAEPKATRLAVFYVPTTSAHLVMWDEVKAAAQVRKITARSWEIRTADDIDRAFAAAIADRVGALILLPHPVASTNHRQIIALCIKHRLPTIYAFSWFAEAGGLMTYGADRADMFRRTAGYVDKILKGAKPVDLPVEQATKFELVVNLKTARALGLTIPRSLLLRADQVIE